MYFTGKRAVFVPPIAAEPVGDPDLIVKGTLYCIAIDKNGKIIVILNSLSTIIISMCTLVNVLMSYNIFLNQFHLIIPFCAILN